MVSKITAFNFQSFSHLEFDVTTGITLIDGWNHDDQTSEGSGKSSVLNALSWCLFGKLPKDVGVDEVVKYGQTSCKVQVDFDNGDHVYRSRKPNDLYMSVDDKLIKGKDAKETQQLIQDYLGLSFESFCQSSYFAQNYAKKFLLSNQEEKGKILGDIQDINIFDKARKEVQELLKIEIEKHSNLKNKIQMDEVTKNNLESQKALVIEFIDKKQEEFEKTRKSILLIRNGLIESTQVDHQEMRRLNEELNSTDLEGSKEDELKLLEAKAAHQTAIAENKHKRSQISTIRNTLTLKEKEVKRYVDKYKSLAEKRFNLSEFIKNPTKKCPTCDTLLENADTSHAHEEQEEIFKEMEETEQQIISLNEFIESNPVPVEDDLLAEESDLKDWISGIDKHLKIIQKVKNEFETTSYKITTLASGILKTEKQIRSYDENLKQEKVDVSKELMQIGAISQDIDAKELEIGQLKLIEVQTSSYIKRLESLKDGFKEIKSHVFNTALNELSHRANQFLSRLFEVQAQVKFMNEDQKIETKILLDERETSLGLLSGGQLRRFCLAIDLALSDMVTSRKTSKLNLLILDEPFQNLSESSMARCIDILSSLNKPILLIEHNSAAKAVVTNVVMMDYVNGTSSIQ